jgi:Carbohydrate-binding module 48 (Isoamylase N-terminal domain)
MKSLQSSVCALHLSLLVTIVGIGGAAAAVRVAEVSETLENRYGSHIDAEGWVHFVVYSPHADQVHLLLFDQPADKIPAQTIPMQRRGDDWQVKIRGQGVGADLLYMYQAKGPNEVSKDDQYGLMFNEHFFLNDPYCQKTGNVTFSAFFSSTPFTDITAPVYAGGGKCTVYDHAQDITPGHV